MVPEKNDATEGTSPGNQRTLTAGSAVKRRNGLLWRTCLSQWRTIMIVALPIVFSPIAIFWDDAERPDAGRMAYCSLLMASFWILELVPLAITGILPVFLYPALGVLSAKKTCGAYFNEVQFIIMGGLIIAIAVEKSRVHERIALSVLMLLGSKPRWIMLGFMLVTAFLSMFLSNTATTAMMMPIANAILEEMRKNKSDDEQADKCEGQYSAESQPSGDCQAPSSPANPSVDTLDRHSIMMEDIPALRSKRCTHSMLADGCTLHGGGHGRKRGVISASPSASSMDAESAVDSSGEVKTSPVDKMLLLSVSYSAQLGGTGLLTGCTPNLVTLAYMSKRFPGSNMNFVNWSGFAFPTMLIVVLYGWVWLQICFMGFRSIFGCRRGDDESSAADAAVSALIRRKYKALGRLRFNECAVMTLFLILFLLWFSRAPGFAPGYEVYFKEDFMSDAVPAIFICTLLFILPSELPPLPGCLSGVFQSKTQMERRASNEHRRTESSSHLQDVDGLNETATAAQDESTLQPDQPSPKKSSRRRTPRLLDWDTVHVKMPWCIILIMGGGLAMAEGMTETGLSSWLGDRFSVFSSVPIWSLPFIIGSVVAVTTDLASVMASCQIYTPVMADLALSLRLNPYLTLLPTTIAASFAFMLPVATPPAAIAFSYGKLRILDMCKAGIVMNVLGVIAVGIAVNTWGRAIFSLDEFPLWAQAALDASGASSVPTGSSNVSSSGVVGL